MCPPLQYVSFVCQFWDKLMHMMYDYRKSLLDFGDIALYILNLEGLLDYLKPN